MTRHHPDRTTRSAPTAAALVIALALVAAACNVNGERPGEPAKGDPSAVVWIYHDVPTKTADDARTDPERLFAPHGYMPAERASQISVNPAAPVDRADPSKGTCVDYLFAFRSPTDWMGVYTLVNGDAWGTKPGIDVQALLGVDANTPLALRFDARGQGVVTFKLGGVSDGPHPSSVRFPIEADVSPTKLTADYRQQTIGPIPAGRLTNLIDPFCIVTSGLDNAGREEVRAQVRNIRIERFDRAPATRPSASPPAK